MKKIGVLSDTHLTGYDQAFEALAVRYFSDSDLIIHAGDMVTLGVLDPLFQLNAEVVAVCGNMDFEEVQAAYPAKRIITVEDVRIGIIHGWGNPHGIRARIRASFEAVDAIVYGHSHQPFSAVESGIFFFNPGSAAESRFTLYRSIGIMRVEGHKIKGEIIPL